MARCRISEGVKRTSGVWMGAFYCRVFADRLDFDGRTMADLLLPRNAPIPDLAEFLSRDGINFGNMQETESN